MKRFRLKSRVAPSGGGRVAGFGRIREDVILVDDEDAHLLRDHQWHVRSYAKDSKHYVVTTIGGQVHTLGRVILGLTQYRESKTNLRGPQVRYLNGDPFDNRRENLAVRTTAVIAEEITA